MISAELNIRRFDKSEKPTLNRVLITFKQDISYNDIKQKVYESCKVSPSENKVIKLRNEEFKIIPYSMMLEGTDSTRVFYVDVTNISLSHTEGMNLLQDAYMNSVKSKLCSMESQVRNAEDLLPQLEWKRQAHLEETVSRLSNKVLFLHRRFDETLPQWSSKASHTVA